MNPVKAKESEYQTAPCTVRSGECYKRFHTDFDYLNLEGSNTAVCSASVLYYVAYIMYSNIACYTWSGMIKQSQRYCLHLKLMENWTEYIGMW